MKRAKTPLAIAVILLVLLFLAIWPLPEESVKFVPLSTWIRPDVRKKAIEIDLPFGFHWGDSSARVEALLAYSSASVVSRTSAGNQEILTVEGLIQPGLKSALFLFEKNALAEVELYCQYDAWPFQRYESRLEELRVFFDGKLGGHSTPIISNRDGPVRENRIGYGWRSQKSNVGVFCRSFSAPSAGGLSVADLVMHYGGQGANFERDLRGTAEDRWKDEIISPGLAEKLQVAPDVIPPGSALGISEWKLLDTSHTGQMAFMLQLAVKLRQNTTIDATKATVQVNFYDTVNDELVLTNADVNYEWSSPRDWKKNNPETLAVTYVRSLDKNQKPMLPGKLFGYVAAVYYNGKLESVHAEPVKLLNLFPLRSFVSPFEDAQSALGRGDYTLAAHLYQQAADQGNLFALENLAWFYAQGKGVLKDYRQAVIFYERASLQNTPRALNALAWFLATCPDKTIRNGAEAVGHATKACELTYWQEWKYIDTLAAASAENGDFKRAISYEEEAIALKGFSPEIGQKMEGRRALYLKRQPYRE